MGVPAVAEVFDIGGDPTATWDGKSWVVGPFVDELVEIPDSDLDEWAGAQMPANYGEALRQVNQVFQGARAIDQLGIGGLPSVADANADDLVVRGAVNVGASLISTSTTGFSILAFGDPDDPDVAAFSYSHQFNSQSVKVGGANRAYWAGETYNQYSADAQFHVGYNDTPASAGSPGYNDYKGAAGTAYHTTRSNEGGTFQIRVRTGVDGSENYVVEMYNTSGVLQGTTTWTAAGTGISIPGNLGGTGGGFRPHPATYGTTTGLGKMAIAHDSTNSLHQINVDGGADWRPFQHLGGPTQTTDATVTTCGSYTLADNSVVSVTVEGIGLQSGGGNRASYRRRMVVYRTGGGGATVLGAVETLGTDRESDATWDFTLDANGNNVRGRVTGKAATTINWLTRWEISEVR